MVLCEMGIRRGSSCHGAPLFRRRRLGAPSRWTYTDQGACSLYLPGLEVMAGGSMPTVAPRSPDAEFRSISVCRSWKACCER